MVSDDQPRRGRPITEDCPSEAAYKRHQRNKWDDTCTDPEGCRKAWAEAQRRYYAKRKGLDPKQ
jgi:hypothetical protein